MIESRIKAGRLPPTELEPQLAWFREALRDSLKIAAKTKKVSRITAGATSGHVNTLPTPELSNAEINTSGYMPITTTSQASHAPLMNHSLSGMVLSPQSFVSTPHNGGPLPWQMNSIPNTGPLGADMDYSWIAPSHNLSDSTSQTFDPSFHLDFEQDVHGSFVPQGSGMLGNHQYPPNWEGQSGGG